MTSAIDQATVPFLPTKDTALRLRHFDQTVYRTDESSTIYNFMDALVGDAGVGTIKKQMLINRLSNSLDTTYFSDLDNVFGNLLRIARMASETYIWNPASDLLTSSQWDEIRVKDSWYRARIKNTFKALALGGSPDGLRMMVKAAIGIDCEVYEMWRFRDYAESIYGINPLDSTANLVMNPSFETGASNWLSDTLTSGVGWSVATDLVLAAARQTGTVTMKLTSGTSVTNPGWYSDMDYVPDKVVGGRQYSLSGYIYRPATTSLTNGRWKVRFYDAFGNSIDGTTVGPSTALTSNAKTRVIYNFTVPANSVRMQLFFEMVGTAASQVVYMDAVLLTQGNTPPTYFDGTNTGYIWSGQVGKSTTVKAQPLEALTRTNYLLRNEVVLYAHKANLTTLEKLQVRNMTKRLAPVDSVITVATSGYGVNLPVTPTNIVASSNYFQISSYVTAKPGSTLTAIEEPNYTRRWLQDGVEKLAPTSAFAEPQEFSQYYLYKDNEDQVTIDTVTYTSEDQSGQSTPEENYQIFKTSVNGWGDWTPYEKCDCPDNYPGGRNGITPFKAPALTPNRKPYVFQWFSQQQYVDAMKIEIARAGGESRVYTGPNSNPFGIKLPIGQSTDTQYRLPNTVIESVENSWTPEMAVSNMAPTRISSVTTEWFSRPDGYTDTSYGE